MQLSERYRPEALTDFISQDKAIRRVRAILKLPSFDRGAFLFTGPSGSGKTSLARVVASELGCSSCMNYTEIKGQDCGVQELRELAEWFRYGAPDGGFKTVIINECHLMSPAARNYSLELMENPPAKRVIILTTTEADWCEETLYSRFYGVALQKPRADAIVKHLEHIASREGFDLSGWNVKRFVQDRHNNIRLCLMDLEVEVAVAA